MKKINKYTFNFASNKFNPLNFTMQSYLSLWPSNQGAYANTTACVQIMYRFVSQLIIPHIEFHNICL